MHDIVEENEETKRKCGTTMGQGGEKCMGLCGGQTRDRH